MSVHRLQIEQLLRDEERLCREVKAELAAVPRPEPARRRVPHRTKHLLVHKGKDGRSVCAAFLLAWWRRRSAFGGGKRLVTTNEINRLAGILRRLET